MTMVWTDAPVVLATLVLGWTVAMLLAGYGRGRRDGTRDGYRAGARAQRASDIPVLAPVAWKHRRAASVASYVAPRVQAR